MNGQFFSSANDRVCHFILAGYKDESFDVEVWKNGKNGRKMLGEAKVLIEPKDEILVKIKKKDSKAGTLKLNIKMLNEDKKLAKEEVGSILSESLSGKLGEFFCREI